MTRRRAESNRIERRDLTTVEVQPRLAVDIDNATGMIVRLALHGADIVNAPLKIDKIGLHQ